MINTNNNVNNNNNSNDNTKKYADPSLMLHDIISLKVYTNAKKNIPIWYHCIWIKLARKRLLTKVQRSNVISRAPKKHIIIG